MTAPITRRRALGGLGAAVLAGPSAAGAPARSMRPPPRATRGARIASLDEILDRAGVSGRVAVAAADPATGAILEARGEGEGLPPASVMKALTAGYALDRLGPVHAFATRIHGTGPVEGGVLRGDLILAGGGDPTLDTPRLDALAAAVAGAGVRRIEGRLLTWDDALPAVRRIDPDQDAHLGYNAAVGGLNLNYNRVHFSWRREGDDYDLSFDARGGDLTPAWTGAEAVLADRARPVYGYGSDGGRDRWTVARRALGAEGARWLPVRAPAAYAADILRVLAAGHGTALPAPSGRAEAPEGAILAWDASSPLTEVIRGMLRYSTNLTAEAIGLAASLRAGPIAAAPVPPAADGRRVSPALAESGARMAGWAEERLGMGAPELRIVDHSGLGDESRVAAGAMAAGMARLCGPEGPAGGIGPLLRPFGMPNAAGEIDAGHPVKVAAKTGTLNFVSGLSGIATAPGGGRVAFAIFCADLERREAGLASGDEIPAGARPWNARAKRLQRALIARWAAEYA